MRTFVYLIFILLLSVTLQSNAQNYPPPTGVYCSCGPTMGTGNGSVDPAVAAKPFVKGILVRVPWNLLEPTDNNFTWTLIDGQITAAKKYGKKISLGIGNGPAVPRWLFDKGVERLIATVPKTDTIAMPWDSIYLAQWSEFVAALGNQYKNDTTIQLVYISNSTSNGFEMQLPFQSIPTLADAGYTDEKMTTSWRVCIDAFNDAFPNHYLSNDFHPVNGSNAVADSVYAYATATIGSRYGANAWWWTQKNAKTVYPAQYAISQRSAKDNKFTGVQFANSGTTDSAKFGEGGMPAALQLAIDDGICYWEIWNQDILNPKFEQLLTDAKCKTGTTNINENVSTANITLYPNPAQNVLYIEGSAEQAPFNISIISLSGKTIFSSNALALHHTINTKQLAQGFYIAVLKSNNAISRVKFRVDR